MSFRVSEKNGFNSNVLDSSSAYSNPQPSLDFISPPETFSIDMLLEQIHKFKQAIMSNQTETAEKRNFMHAVAANARSIDTTALVGCFFQLCSLPMEQIEPVMKEICSLTEKGVKQKNEQIACLEELKKFDAEKMGLNDVDKQRKEELTNKVKSLQEQISKTYQNIKENESKLLCNISVLKMDQNGQKMETRLNALTEEYKKRGFHDV